MANNSPPIPNLQHFQTFPDSEMPLPMNDYAAYAAQVIQNASTDVLNRAAASISSPQASIAKKNKIPDLFHPDVDACKLIEIVRTMQLQLSTSDLNSAYSKARNISENIKVQQAKNAEKQKEIQKKNASISEKTEIQKIIGYVMSVVALIVSVVAAVFAVVAAVGAVVVTAGLAVGAVVAALFAVMAVWDTVARFISSDPKNTRVNAFGETVQADYSFAGMIRLACELSAKNGDLKVAGLHGYTEGMPGVKTRAEYEKHVNDWTTGITVAIIVITIAINVLSFTKLGDKILSAGEKVLGAVSGAEGAAQAAQASVQAGASGNRVAAALINSAGGFLSATGGLINASISGFLADDRYRLSSMKVNKEQLDGIILYLQNSFDISQDNFRAAMSFQEYLRNYIAVALANNIEQQIKISRNC